MLRQLIFVPNGAGGGGGSSPINLTAWQDAQPIPDMVGSQPYTWHGLVGGLYPGGTNTPSSQYTSDGVAAAALVEKLDTSGNPSVSGKIVMLTIGMSNAKVEFCGSTNQPTACRNGSLLGKHWDGRGITTNSNLVIVNGAEPGYTLAQGAPPGTLQPYWFSDPNDLGWDNFASSPNKFSNYGVTAAQVQIVLVKTCMTHFDAPNAVGFPAHSIGNGGNVVAEYERDYLKNAINEATARYANLKQVLLACRTYGGYQNNPLVNENQTPEPYAYENGWACKWVIEDYITGAYTPGPWIGWAGYLWCNGATPRGDGMNSPVSDYAADMIHPTDAMADKWGTYLHDQLLANTYGFMPWYAHS